MDIYMETQGNFRKQKIRLETSNEFYCEICDYVAKRQWNLDKHKLTAKHQKNYKKLLVSKKSSNLGCPFCPKTFKTRGGKWKHMKKCSRNPNILIEKLELEKERNKELKQKLQENENEKIKLENKYLKDTVEILEKHKGNTQNINTQNNNYFNIQVYLDEKCKNAMPIMDFIRDLQFKLTDINPERPASTIESLSKCITDKLEDMDETERPVHCSDAKRLVFHVKDASGWTKDVNNKKIDKAIGWANMRHQGAWIKKATSEDMASQKNDLDFLHMNVAMGKYSDDPTKAKKKIKRAIAKAVPIKEAIQKS